MSVNGALSASICVIRIAAWKVVGEWHVEEGDGPSKLAEERREGLKVGYDKRKAKNYNLSLFSCSANF